MLKRQRVRRMGQALVLVLVCLSAVRAAVEMVQEGRWMEACSSVLLMWVRVLLGQDLPEGREWQRQGWRRPVVVVMVH